MSEKSFDEIIVPDKAEQIVNQAIKRGRRSILRKRSMVTVIAISLFVMGVFGTCYASPSVAATLSKIPLIGNLFVQFADEGLKTASQNGLTIFPGLEVTKENETVALKEIYYDKSRISLGLAFKGLNPYASEPVSELYYNDKLISGSLGGGITEASKDIYYMDLSTNIPNDLPDKFLLKLVVREQSGFKSNFEFTVPLDRSAANIKTTEYTLMKSFTENDRTLLIKKIQFTPASLGLDFEYTSPKTDEGDIMLKLFDDKGEEVQLNTYSGPAKFNGNYRIDSLHAIFNPLKGIPNGLELVIKNKVSEKTVLSAKIDIKQ